MTQSPPQLTGACIGVCKFLRAGPEGAHCIGCSMTKAQKDGFKTLPDDAARLAYLETIRAQQRAMGGFRHWPEAYRAKCIRKGMTIPQLDRDQAA